MTLMEKFNKLTLEQREKIITIKDGVELETFLSGIGLELMSEEKTQILEYFQSGKLTLSDEELDSVAGGCGSNFSGCPLCGKPNIHIDYQAGNIFYLSCTDYRCRHKWIVNRASGSVQ